MKILVLSFYYPPDLCAGSFRTAALIESLRAAVPAGSEIDVITTAPNRYHSFRAEAPEVEHHAGLSIFRIPLPDHQSGMIDQGRSFVWYARGVLRRVARRDYDIVYASSSRLMTAVLGAFVSARRGTRLYLDIRDIFVDNIRYVLPNRVSWFARPVFAALERWAVTRADVVNLVSRGFADYFDPRYPGQRFTYHTNGIDTAFLKAVPRKAVSTPRARPSLLTVLYAGNVGEGQGLHAILPPLAKAMEGRVRFEVVGGGGRIRALEAALAELGVTNVELTPPVERRELLKRYRRADVLFLHLHDYEAFEKVLPSKVFEYAAVGKPVWAGVAGFSANFIRSEITNAAVFDPCDLEGAISAFETLSLEDTPRPGFIHKYSRESISRRMAADIIFAAGGRPQYRESDRIESDTSAG